MDNKLTDELLAKYVQGIEDVLLRSLPKEDEIDYEFSQSFEKRMNKLIKRERRKERFQFRNLLQYKKALAFSLVFFMALTLTFTVQSFKERFFSIFTTTHKEYTTIEYISDEDVPSIEEIPLRYPVYVPEGFELVEEETHPLFVYRIYRDSNGSEIMYHFQSIATGTLMLDTEDTELKNMKILDREVQYFTNKGMTTVLWDDTISTYQISSSLELDELIKMVESIIENE